MDKDILRESFKLLDAITEQPSDLEAAFLIYESVKPLVDCIETLRACVARLTTLLSEAERQTDEMQTEIDDLEQQLMEEETPRDGVIYAGLSPMTSRHVWLEATPPTPDFIVDRHGTVRTPEEQDAANYELYLKRAALGLA